VGEGDSNVLPPATVLYELRGAAPGQALVYFHGDGWSCLAAESGGCRTGAVQRWQPGQ
jgi:hypothetical protein